MNNAADEVALKEKATREGIARRQADEDLVWLMNDQRGRRFLWRQMSQSHVFIPVFNPDAMVMAWNEGRRNEGLQLLTQINRLCPELYPVMAAENAIQPEEDNNQ